MLLHYFKSINSNYSKKYYAILSAIIILAYAIKIVAINNPTNQIALAPSNNYSNSIINQSYYNYYLEKQLVAHYVRLYSKCHELPKLIKRSQIPLKYVMQELEKRNLPKELALLPIIESSYESKAVSHAGAKGIWQISRVAGKRYGVIHHHSNGIQDKRSDLIASTDAALNYLEFLYNRFGQDWLTAIAAYNAGEGRVGRAIKNNKSLGKDVNYWELNLPTETKHYVPKMIALSIIFNDPQYQSTNFNAI